jgi:hypothetical protein
MAKGRRGPMGFPLGSIAALLFIATTLPMVNAAGTVELDSDKIEHAAGDTTKLTIKSDQGHILDVGGATIATVASGGTTFTGTTTVAALTASGTVTMNAASQAITHSGTTTLAISSGGDITLAAGSTKDVTIEDVHIAGLTIGTANNADLLTLADAKVTVDSEIELSASAAKITHENAAGGLTIESSYGYVDVEDIRFTGAKIGVAADIDVITLSSGGVAVAGTLDTTGLATFASATVTGTFTASGSFTVGTTLGVTGATTLTGTTLMKESVTLDKTAATITHTDAAGTPAGSLTISSTTGNVVISAKTGSTVDVESIRFTDAKIGIAADDDLITLGAGAVTVAGSLATSDKVAIAGSHGDATKELYVNGDVHATGTVTSASDARYKRDVRPIKSAMTIARAVNPVTFDFKVEKFPERRFPTARQSGVIAQELEMTLPDLVTVDDAGYKGVDYTRLGVYALAALKELDSDVDAEFEAQRGRIATQAKTIVALEKRLAEMDEAIRTLSQAVVEVAK